MWSWIVSTKTSLLFFHSLARANVRYRSNITFDAFLAQAPEISPLLSPHHEKTFFFLIFWQSLFIRSVPAFRLTARLSRKFVFIFSLYSLDFYFRHSRVEWESTEMRYLSGSQQSRKNLLLFQWKNSEITKSSNSLSRPSFRVNKSSARLASCDVWVNAVQQRNLTFQTMMSKKTTRTSWRVSKHLPDSSMAIDWKFSIFLILFCLYLDTTRRAT